MRNWRAVLVVVAVAAGVATPILGAGAATPRVAVRSCTPSAMSVSRGTSQGAAGTIYTPLVFTNHGAACAIWGVPSVQPVAGAAHRPVGPAAHNQSMGEMPMRHVLATGRSVSAAFGVVETSNFTPSRCVARHANGVLVSLGGFVRRTFVPMSISVCTTRASTTTRLIIAGVNG